MPSSTDQTLSTWMDTMERTDYSPLRENTRADVCIIGAGIAGLTTAYMLTKEGKSVVVIDDGPILSGETERTTAHISNQIDDRYTEIIRIHGIDIAKKAADAHSKAIDAIEDIAKREKIDCDFLRVDGYLFLSPHHDRKTLEEEMDAAHEAGLTDVTLLESTPIPGLPKTPCLRFPRQGQFHPLVYLNALATIIVENGGHIYAHTHASSIEEKSPAVVHTSSGHTITANSLVVATNAPVNDNVHIYSKQAPYRSFVIAGPVVKGSIPMALYWDTLEPYHYVRLQPFNDESDLLIVGGEDHKTATENDGAERFKALEKWGREVFPGLKSITHTWSGQVLETIDGLAMIGRKPAAKDHIFVATGDSGMGMTHGTIAGILLCDLIMGRKSEWEEVFHPGRHRLKATGEFLKEGAHIAKELATDYLSPGEVDDEAKIKKGEGAVLRKGIHKIALYRDEHGTAHRFSAVCPHKGCIIHWNSTEKSWDCPCHGSRFDTDGNALNGPTIKGLKPVSQ